MNILHIANIDLSIDGGGMNLVIPELARLQYEEKSDEDIINLLVLNNKKAPSGKYKFNVFYWNEINDITLNQFDLVVFHSVYNLKFFNLYKKCLKHAIPYIIVSHGGLATTTLKKNVLKKRLYKYFFLDSFVNKAASLCFTSNNEHQHSLFPNKKSIYVPNPIQSHTEAPLIEKKVDTEIQIIYLSKIDFYYKGLDLLMHVLYNRELADLNFNLTIYGYGESKDIDLNNIPKEEKDVLKLKSLINENHNIKITYKGPLFGSEKLKEIRNSDIYILTSRSEAMPLSITEALSLGVPCLITEGTNMGDFVEKFNAGWVSKFSEIDLLQTIKRAIGEYRQSPSYYRNNAYKCYRWLSSKQIGKDSLRDYKRVMDDWTESCS